MNNNLDETSKQPQAQLMRFADAVGVALTEAHAARTTGKLLGPVTGFDKLDTELGGRFAPDVHSLNGDPNPTLLP